MIMINPNWQNLGAKGGRPNIFSLFFWYFLLKAKEGDTRFGRVTLLLVCQWMTIYDIHDIFMVIHVMYYTKYKQNHTRSQKIF